MLRHRFALCIPRSKDGRPKYWSLPALPTGPVCHLCRRKAEHCKLRVTDTVMTTC